MGKLKWENKFGVPMRFTCSYSGLFPFITSGVNAVYHWGMNSWLLLVTKLKRENKFGVPMGFTFFY